MAQGFVCPVCGFNDPSAPPFEGGQNEWYQEICPSCGTQFSYDDASTHHDELRRHRLTGGAKWWSSRPAPSDFNGIEQLRKARLTD